MIYQALKIFDTISMMLSMDDVVVAASAADDDDNDDGNNDINAISDDDVLPTRHDYSMTVIVGKI